MNTQDVLDTVRLVKTASELRLRNIALEAFIRKLHDRLHPSILEDNVMTRLDPDLQEELETLLKRKK